MDNLNSKISSPKTTATNNQLDSLGQFSSEAIITDVRWGKNVGKVLYLKYPDDPNSLVSITVPRSACVTSGDIVVSDSKINTSAKMTKEALFVKCRNGFAQITPLYSVKTILHRDIINLSVQIKEISSEEEHAGYHALSHYHYRERGLFGRHSPLVAVTSHPMLPKVIGYIDLTTAFFVNTPRRNLLDAPSKLNGVSWERWTQDVIRERIPMFVRIARCVVHPELRSLGLGKILVDNSIKFANLHWQSANWKPYFIEISADMLRYIPFVEKAGMRFVGETEGNLTRIVKDLRYLKANEGRLQKEIFIGEVVGILDTKLSQLKKAGIVATDLGEKNIGDYVAKQIKNPTINGWARLTGVLSLPKPHYMKGLNKEATALISKRINKISIGKSPSSNGGDYVNSIYKSRLKEPIKIENIYFTVNHKVRRTKLTHAVERAFEISLGDISQSIIKNLSIHIAPGEIVVVTGLSGSGKTSLLNLLSGKLFPSSGNIHLPKGLKIGELKPISQSKPLIEVFGKQDVGRGMFWLGAVGLSEPYLYVKPFSILSAGQKYRAMIANLLTRGANLWLIDEFCENLDIINTNLLAKRISSLAHKVGATVVLASSDPGRFANALLPDKYLVLKGGTDSEGFNILTHQEWKGV